MTKVVVTDTNLTNIANAIRTKGGTSELIKPSEMATAIENLPSGGDYNALIDSTATYTSGGILALIKDIKTFDTSEFATFEGLFSGCRLLTEPPMLDTANVTSLQYCFQSCSSLTKMVQWDTREVSVMSSCFYGCTNLRDVPIFNTQWLYSAGNMFNGCNNLTNESLDNILQMFTNATRYTGTKTLYALGFRRTKYSQSKWESLPHWQDFVNAGWETGY